MTKHPLAAGARWCGLLLLPLLLLIAASAPVAQSHRKLAGPAAFGFDGWHAAGTRPLLTILMDFSDAHFAPDHTPAFYRQLLFGTEEGRLVGSVAGRGSYFDENSKGTFYYTNAGILGPLTFPDDPATPQDESKMDCAYGWGAQCGATLATPQNERRNILERRNRIIRATMVKAAAQAGFDFARFDRNHDGRVGPDELQILLISADREGDHLTTTSPTPWRNGRTDFSFPSSGPRRLEGYILAPSVPVPAGPAPWRDLYAWWSAFRGDHWLAATAQDRGTPPLGLSDASTPVAPDALPPPDYEQEGLEGHVLAQPGAGLVPLYSWYSPNRGDTFVTSDPSWSGAAILRSRHDPDYVFEGIEGYAFSPDLPRPPDTIPLYSYWSPNDLEAIGAGTRGMDPACVPVPGGVSVCISAPGGTPTGIPGSGESVGAASVAHELDHTLGAIDVYGDQARRNLGYTTMAATILPSRDSRAIVDLDPYHRMRFGWLRPTVLSTETTGCFRLSAAESSPTAGVPQAYLVYDPGRGTNEYFLLEYRLPLLLNYDGDPWATGSTMLPDQGLAIWLVKTDDSHVPLDIRPYDRPDVAATSDKSLFLVPARGTLGMPLYGFGLWTKARGPAHLSWLNGDSAGVVVRVESDSVRTGTITIRLGEAPCTPRPTHAAARVQASSLPAPVGTDCHLAQHIVACRIKTPAGILLRRTSLSTTPGGTLTVRWTLLKPSRELVGTLRLADRLPTGYQVAKGQATVLLSRAHRNGRYLVRAPIRRGRSVVTTHLRYRLAAGTHTSTVTTALGVFSATGFGETDPSLSTIATPPPTPPSTPPPPTTTTTSTNPPPPATTTTTSQQPPAATTTTTTAAATTTSTTTATTPPAMPDLVISDLGPTFVTVSNIGKASAGAFVVTVSGVGSFPFSGLDAGQSAGQKWQQCTPGTLTAVADAKQQVAESDEGNNSESVNVSCQ